MRNKSAMNKRQHTVEVFIYECVCLLVSDYWIFNPKLCNGEKIEVQRTLLILEPLFFIISHWG